jgi:hypothetical protein
MNQYKYNGWKILQIIPAQVGWKAVHCQQSENRQIKIFNRAIICWALVEAVGESDAGRTQARGIEQDSNRLVIVEDLINTNEIAEDGIDPNQYFLGYDDPESHKESDYWIKQADTLLKTKRNRIKQEEVSVSPHSK